MKYFIVIDFYMPYNVDIMLHRHRGSKLETAVALYFNPSIFENKPKMGSCRLQTHSCLIENFSSFFGKMSVMHRRLFEG